MRKEDFHQKIVLASSSPFRKFLLDKLNLPYETAVPDIDESPHQDESAEDLVKRLAHEKAHQLAADFPNALIIGSDQVARRKGIIMGKPGTREHAIQQLSESSGETVTFLTGLCVLDTRESSSQVCCEPFKVHFKELTRADIERYLDKEEPYQCAGSFKSEGYGITLFARLEGDDPNSLIGLPLIQLTKMLVNRGIHLP